MTKNSFRLEKLLKLRLAVRDQCQSRLAGAIRAQQVVVAKAVKVKKEFDEANRHSRVNSQIGELEVASLTSLNQYKSQLTTKLQELEEERKPLDEEVEARRGEVVEADRELRTLKKLRERIEARSQQQERNKDGKELQEIALQRY